MGVRSCAYCTTNTAKVFKVMMGINIIVSGGPAAVCPSGQLNTVPGSRQHGRLRATAPPHP
jgi:hypothetical protein